MLRVLCSRFSAELERTREELTHVQQQAVTFKAALERASAEAKDDSEKLRAEVPAGAGWPSREACEACIPVLTTTCSFVYLFGVTHVT